VELTRRQQQEEERKQQEALKIHEEQLLRQKFVQLLSQHSIPVNALENLEEMGFVQSHGLEKIVKLLIANKGNLDSIIDNIQN